MSYHTFPIDQLMRLTPAQLSTALRLFNQELDGTIKFLSEDPTARRDGATLDDLNNLLTLRKVFQARLDELAEESGESEEQAPAPLPATERFYQNELQEA